MRIIDGGNFSYARGVSYPIVVAEDTEYRLANFCQQTPHTAIFDVKPGVLVRFVDCNLVNVTVPDGAEIVGGNLAHVVPTSTGNPAKPIVRLLHECEKCASAQAELAERVKAGTLPMVEGRVDHSSLKEVFRARRLSAKVTADLTKQESDNAAALAKWSK